MVWVKQKNKPVILSSVIVFNCSLHDGEIISAIEEMGTDFSECAKQLKEDWETGKFRFPFIRLKIEEYGGNLTREKVWIVCGGVSAYSERDDYENNESLYYSYPLPLIGGLRSRDIRVNIGMDFGDFRLALSERVMQDSFYDLKVFEEVRLPYEIKGLFISDIEQYYLKDYIDGQGRWICKYGNGGYEATVTPQKHFFNWDLLLIRFSGKLSR